MNHLGLRLDNFADKDDAWKCVEAAVEANKKEFEHDEPNIPNDNEYLERFFYVRGRGKDVSWTQDQVKVLEGEASVKTKKQIMEAQCFVEGFGVEDTTPGEPSVKVENATYVELEALLSPNRSHACIPQTLLNRSPAMKHLVDVLTKSTCHVYYGCL